MNQNSEALLSMEVSRVVSLLQDALAFLLLLELSHVTSDVLGCPAGLRRRHGGREGWRCHLLISGLQHVWKYRILFRVKMLVKS